MQLLDREQELLAQVPSDGGIGNTRLMRALGWAEGEYWEVRNRLVERGVLEVGRGRGGSVRRPVVPEGLDLDGVAALSSAPAREEDALEPVGRHSEAALYPPIARVLKEQWIRDKRIERSILHLTAQQGRRSTGGRWTRPDISLIALSTYPYVPGRHFDVITFEVKPQDTIDVTCVYEALAHLRSATRAYVLLHVPDRLVDELSDTLIEISAEAKRHGVGMITFGDPADYETWEERIEPTRQEPDPRKLNDFLATQFPQDDLEDLIRWFR